MRLVIIALLVILACCVSFADVVREGTLQARSDGSSITLSWVTDDETDVARFEIERRVGTSGAFGYVATVTAKGPSLYEFVDHSAYKISSMLYQYRIKIVFSNGSPPVYVGPVTVNHTVSGVRRTWGSIKAMFR